MIPIMNACRVGQFFYHDFIIIIIIIALAIRQRCH